jgi:rfaE bifunctional protein nucleotidyltransferase chain/domain
VPDTALSEVAEQLRRRWSAHAVCVTCGPLGAELATGGQGSGTYRAPEAPAGSDPCGAGDRFATRAAAALGAGHAVAGAVQAAVADASQFVAAGGAGRLVFRSGGPASPASPETTAAQKAAAVRASGGRVVATGGCFDLLHGGHLHLLEAAAAEGDCLIVCLNSDESVRRLKGPARPVVGQVGRTRMLRALRWVDDVVVFAEDDPCAVLASVRPHLWVKGGDYSDARLPETETLRGWGAETVFVPYLEGRSTTSLIEEVTQGVVN